MYRQRALYCFLASNASQPTKREIMTTRVKRLFFWQVQTLLSTSHYYFCCMHPCCQVRPWRKFVLRKKGSMHNIITRFNNYLANDLQEKKKVGIPKLEMFLVVTNTVTPKNNFKWMRLTTNPMLRWNSLGHKLLLSYQSK